MQSITHPFPKKITTEKEADNLLTATDPNKLRMALIAAFMEVQKDEANEAVFTVGGTLVRRTTLLYFTDIFGTSTLLGVG